METSNDCSLDLVLTKRLIYKVLFEKLLKPFFLDRLSHDVINLMMIATFRLLTSDPGWLDGVSLDVTLRLVVISGFRS